MQINRKQVWVRAYLWTLAIHVFMAIILLSKFHAFQVSQIPQLMNG